MHTSIGREYTTHNKAHTQGQSDGGETIEMHLNLAWSDGKDVISFQCYLVSASGG